MNKSRRSANLVSKNNIFSSITNNRVGIGTTDPQYTLDVLGDINFTGTFRQSGSPFVASRWTTGTGDDIYRLNGDVGIGTTNPTSALQVVGDASVSGAITATSFSGDGSNLTGINAGATGGGDDEIFYENGQIVTTDYTISTSKNAMTAGPIGIATGITVTIPSGSTWTIV
jgi:hypothetical protein